MQRIVLASWLALAAASAFAQTPPATTATADASAPDAAKPMAAYKFVEPRVIADYPLPSKADPRVCLEFATQQQIIACANRYLPRRKG